MPIITGVQGFTSLSQQVRLVLEPTAGEQVLMPLSTGAGTMSLTTQPNTLSPTTGMHLHFYIFGNATAGTIVIVGTNASGGAQTSITYHVPVAPQNAQGYTEFTTKEAWATVTASSITLTSLTPCQVMVFGSYAAKYLVPITADSEEKIPKYSPQDKRGILWKNFRVSQLTKGASLDKFDAALYGDSLWAAYMLFGNTPTVTTVPASPTTKLASTAIAASMTLTTGPAAPGEFLIFSITGNTTSGTIVVGGTDQYGNAYGSNETITFTSAATQTVYSTRRYSVVNNGGANKFATTGGTSASIAVTGVFAWQYSWLYDGINNTTISTASLEVFNGVFGYVLPYTTLSDGTITYSKEKELVFSGKGFAQDYCVVGDPTNTSSIGSNPFATLAQPTTLPYVSWPASWYVDAGNGGTPLTTQDGTFLDFKLQWMTGRKAIYAGDGAQRWAFTTVDSEPDVAMDATIILKDYQNYINYFKPNVPLILGVTFTGTFLGMVSGSAQYEQWQFILPAKIDTNKNDMAKNPVEGTVKFISEYNQANLGYAAKINVISQMPPIYTS